MSHSVSSLLTHSAVKRLVLAMPLLALLWAAIFWAVQLP